MIGKAEEDKDWWAPVEIRFTREQMIFLILNMNLLAHGAYPPDPKGSGYTEPPINAKGKSKRAAFETPAQLHAELTWRLRETGLSGKLLVAEVKGIYLELTKQEETREIRAKDILERLSRESRTALNYISGWRRRKQSYTDWKRDARRRWKNHGNRGYVRHT